MEGDGIKSLTNEGVNVHDKNEKEETVLHLVAQQESDEKSAPIIRLLLAEGSKVDGQDCHGKTALHNICTKPNIKSAKVLVEHGANTNLKDEDGKTALHFASDLTDSGVIVLLINYGGDLLISDNNGITPLDVAVSNGE